MKTGPSLKPFRGSDDVGRRSRDRFRFAGYMTGTAACSTPLGLQRKRRARRQGVIRRDAHAGLREEVDLPPYVEHVPPDTTAAFFWLKNRDPAHGATPGS
jgi:hypothetical protein